MVLNSPCDYTYADIASACKRVRGAIAQLGERLDRTQEVAGSSPASSIQTIVRDGPLLEVPD